ncbi:MAG: putative ATPase [Gammaproteobacteria bacterium]|nr:putative ATPase [Gammaproteobacteria bacterium]
MPISKQILREILTDQRDIRYLDGAVTRQKQALSSEYFSSDLILIITGIRRGGKSTLLQAIRKEQPQQDYYCNFDDERLATFTVEDFAALHEVLIEKYGEQDCFYFDEIQNIEGWERFIRRLHDHQKKILITGSNAAMLSQELGTRLTGRYRQLELLPFSFNEYLAFHQLALPDPDSTVGKGIYQQYFHRFIEDGGIPGYQKLSDEQYLKDLYEGILYRDVVTRHKITKVHELKSLIYYAASNVSKIFSYGKLRQMLALSHASTVKAYLDYLQESYLIFVIPKFDDSVKRQILAPKKLYFIDTKLLKLIGFRPTSDQGRLLENAVFLALRQKHTEIFYFSENKECDFIVKCNTGYQAIQVTCSLHDPDTKQREVDGLLEALIFFDLKSGLILTLDEEIEIEITKDHKTYHIHVMPIWKWILWR